MRLMAAVLLNGGLNHDFELYWAGLVGVGVLERLAWMTGSVLAAKDVLFCLVGEGKVSHARRLLQWRLSC